MKKSMMRALFWAPRVLGIALTMLLALLAVDVFREGYSFWETAGALLMHQLPALLVLAAVAVGWRWEWAGALMFLACAALHIVLFWAPQRWPALLIITTPLALTGVLFLLHWMLTRAELRRA